MDRHCGARYHLPPRPRTAQSFSAGRVRCSGDASATGRAREESAAQGWSGRLVGQAPRGGAARAAAQATAQRREPGAAAGRSRS
eukprot:4995675-Pyramimonas_sp.AAC.1